MRRTSSVTAIGSRSAIITIGTVCALVLCTALTLPSTAIARHGGRDHGRGNKHRRQAVGALLPSIQIISTVPSNGDLNPYGVAFVPSGFPQDGALNAGDLLISNFNNSANLQGTGTTIVRVAPGGQLSTFFQGTPGIGLTLALGTLRRGFVVVGSVPTTDGTFATIQQGSLLIINDMGSQVASLSDPVFLDGPWGLAINDRGDNAQLFVADVLNGTVSRLDVAVGSGGVTVQNMTTIASGYAHRSDPAALVLGPAGLAYDSSRDILYIASSADNEIFAVADASEATGSAGMGSVVYDDPVHLHGPVGLALAPNGHLITANGDAVNADPNQPSEVVEFTVDGDFVAQLQLDSAPDAGFGVAVSRDSDAVRVAAVDDDTNTVEILGLNF
jgi:hypothetical protein